MQKSKNICIILYYGNKSFSLIDLDALKNANVRGASKGFADLFVGSLVVCETLESKIIKNVELKEKHSKNLFERIEARLYGHYKVELIYDQKEDAISLEELKEKMVSVINHMLDFHIRTSLLGNRFTKWRVKKVLKKIKKVSTYHELINILKKIG